MLFVLSFISICVAEESYSIEIVLNKLQERMNKSSNFEFDGHRIDKKFEYSVSEERSFVSEEIKMLFEVASQNGEFKESYEVDSSNSEGLFVRHQSTISKEGSRWSQQDMGESANSFNRRPAITDASPYDPTQKGIFDAHLGLYNQYSFQNVPLAEWSKKNFMEKSEITTTEDGKIKIVYIPDEKAYKKVLLVDPNKDFLLYRVEFIDHKGNLIMVSEITQSKELEGAIMPQIIESKQYKYINGKKVCVNERTIELDVKTITPSLSSSTFKLDFSGKRFYDRRNGMTILALPEEDIYLDPALFDFAEHSAELSSKNKTISQQSIAKEDYVNHSSITTSMANNNKREAQNEVNNYVNEKQIVKTPRWVSSKTYKYVIVLVVLFLIVLFGKIIVRRAGPPVQ